MTALISSSLTRTAGWWICTKSFQVMQLMPSVLLRIFEEWVIDLIQLYQYGFSLKTYFPRLAIIVCRQGQLTWVRGEGGGCE